MKKQLPTMGEMSETGMIQDFTHLGYVGYVHRGEPRSKPEWDTELNRVRPVIPKHWIVTVHGDKYDTYAFVRVAVRRARKSTTAIVIACDELAACGMSPEVIQNAKPRQVVVEGYKFKTGCTFKTDLW